MSKLNSKRFVVRQSLIGKNQVITVNFKNGKSRELFLKSEKADN